MSWALAWWLEAAMAQQKPMVIVVESDPKRGAVALEHLLACAPESMRLNLEELFERRRGLREGRRY